MTNMWSVFACTSFCTWGHKCQCKTYLSKHEIFGIRQLLQRVRERNNELRGLNQSQYLSFFACC